MSEQTKIINTIDSEKAFDLLPFVADIYDKVDMRGYIARKKFEVVKNNAINKQKSKDKQEPTDMATMLNGIDMFVYVMKKSEEVKEEFFEIVAIIEGRELEDIKRQPPAKTFKTITLLFEDIETMDFFTQAMK